MSENFPPLIISLNSKVTLHFAVFLDDGNEVDSTFQRQPGSFVMGDGSLLPGFEKRLLGLKAGDQQQFKIPASEGFGERQSANIQRMKRSEFGPDLTLQTGVVLAFAQQDGKETPGMVLVFDEDEVEVDFNHPLAGRDLVFKVYVLAVDHSHNQDGI